MLYDAIARSSGIDEVCSFIEKGNFDAIISLSGFECFDNDMQMLRNIKANLPEVKQILFGYYPTQFPQEILNNSSVDIILLGEPEYPAFDLLKRWLGGSKNYEGINGIAFRSGINEIKVRANSRITDLNELPIPAYDLLSIEHYSEAFLPTPFGMIQSARGCPYKCNYCVKSYGTKLSALSAENMLEHLKQYIQLFNIKSLRFIDDTFTAVPARVIRFCQLLEQNDIHIKWTCLSRADTLNKKCYIG